MAMEHRYGVPREGMRGANTLQATNQQLGVAVGAVLLRLGDLAGKTGN
jgi:hypothetical protein